MPRADYKINHHPTKLRIPKHLIHTQGGRLNTIDHRSAHTKNQVQKQQQLEASKQTIVSSWPDPAGPGDRTQAVEQLVNRHDNLKGKYASTTTLRTKQAWSQFSIIEFFTKEARTKFVELVTKDVLDPQIPARSRPTPPLCNSNLLTTHRQAATLQAGLGNELSMAHLCELVFQAFSNIYGDLCFVMFCCLHAEDLFVVKYTTEWQQWGGQKGTTRKADGYKPQVFFTIHIEAFTAQTAAALDTQYATLQHQRKQTHTKDEDDEMDGGISALRGQAKVRASMRRRGANSTQVTTTPYSINFGHTNS